MTLGMQYHSLPVKIIRGGSSKGVFIRQDALPPPGPERDQLALRLFGSPDIRQIDGLGGADKLTSKLAVMGTPTRGDCDISYLFAQVGTEFADVDWSSNCGNISAGAALFAALDRVGRIENEMRHIQIEQANTGRRLGVKVPLLGDDPIRSGVFEIGGVPGTGPKIELEFADFAGSCLGHGLFPTGNRKESLCFTDGTSLTVTIIDMANLNILVRAIDVGIDATSSLHQMQQDPKLLQRLDQIREAVSMQLGLAVAETASDFIRRSVNPLVNILTEPRPFRTLNGTFVARESHDLFACSYARGAFSRAFPGTGAIGTAIAACISGTLAEVYGAGAGIRDEIRIGHPSGCLAVAAEVIASDTDLNVRQANIGRTARLLIDGTAYLD
ncbi:PrpF domain-containing protein (plasmid) [Neorhizobium sp. DAR64861/K0K2]|uniref:PrpF domain-containing protein n=1 Tax=Neorhizobium sp. DAR64861/K0K2 TaxID=3421956 RepID=UPI003D26D968